VSRGVQCASDKYPGVFSEVASYDSFVTSTLTPSKRVRYLISSILENLELSLARTPNESDFLNAVSQAERDALLQLYDRQGQARYTIFRQLESLIVSVGRDRARLTARQKALELGKLKARRRKLIKGIYLAQANKLGANRSKDLLVENRRFFKSFL
jgi:hypothetical protein